MRPRLFEGGQWLVAFRDAGRLPSPATAERAAIVNLESAGEPDLSRYPGSKLSLEAICRTDNGRSCLDAA
jgi:hypothetical protein